MQPCAMNCNVTSAALTVLRATARASMSLHDSITFLRQAMREVAGTGCGNTLNIQLLHELFEHKAQCLVGMKLSLMHCSPQRRSSWPPVKIFSIYPRQAVE